jgi:hypothetical protein
MRKAFLRHARLVPGIRDLRMFKDADGRDKPGLSTSRFARLVSVHGRPFRGTRVLSFEAARFASHIELGA